MKEFKITASDGLELAAALFEHDDPKAIVQVIHGAKEHKERYYDFIQYLNNNGYAVIVSDNRGHGKSVNETYYLGHFTGVQQMLDDQFLITQTIKALYPDKDLYLFGHSFGSALARDYLQNHDDEIKKLLLTGTVFPIPVSRFAEKLCDLSLKVGSKASTKGLPALIANVPVDSWVCANPVTMAAYRKDPLVQRCKYTTEAAETIIASVSMLTDYNYFRCKNPDLEILSANGAGDPFLGGSLGLKMTVAALRRIGYTKIDTIVYQNMKHEVINEAENAKVYADFLQFFDK